MLADKPDETRQIMELIGKQDDVKLTKDKATGTYTEEHGEARLRLMIYRSQEETQYIVSTNTTNPSETFGFDTNIEHHLPHRYTIKQKEPMRY